jgi:hypothetical protein
VPMRGNYDCDPTVPKTTVPFGLYALSHTARREAASPATIGAEAPSMPMLEEDARNVRTAETTANAIIPPNVLKNVSHAGDIFFDLIDF